MNKTIYSIVGVANTGKTSIVKGVYALTRKRFPNILFKEINSKNDITIILDIGGIRIGIESQGDPNSRLEKSLSTFSNENCDVILCASRTRGMTVDWINSYKNEYEIIRVNQSRLLNKNDWEENNEKVIQELFKLVISNVKYPKHVVVFGAGASFGSDNVRTPPLANNLFEEIVKYDPHGWGNISVKYKPIFNDDFEAGMDTIAKDYPNKVARLQKGMAGYFFNFVPLDGNMYHAFAKIIKKNNWDGALVSLNYERLLDQSLLGAGISPVMGIPSLNQIEINLPHGCCNIFCEGNYMPESAINTLNGLNVISTGTPKLVDDPIEFKAKLTQEALPPVMSYFHPEKHTTACVNMINLQRYRFQDLIKNAEKLIVVGVAIRENDKHIWEPISKTNAHFYYCSGKNELDMFKGWVKKKRSNKENTFLNGFWNECWGDFLNILGLKV